MKYAFLVLITLWCPNLFSQSSLYDIRIKTFNNEHAQLSEWKGQKILIVAASLNALQNGRLKYLDSLQSSKPGITVIVMPVLESTDSTDAEKVKRISKGVKSNLVIIRPDRVKKADADRQHSLMKWLTNPAMNLHFRADIRSDVQFYVVSRYGALYAKLEKGVPLKVIADLLNEPDIREYPYIN